MFYISFRPEPYWLHRWFFLLFSAGAFLAIDDQTYLLIPWGNDKSYELSPGVHTIRFYFRYRWIPAHLGKREWRIDIHQNTHFMIKNGILNQSPFHLYENAELVSDSIQRKYTRRVEIYAGLSAVYFLCFSGLSTYISSDTINSRFFIGCIGIFLACLRLFPLRTRAIPQYFSYVIIILFFIIGIWLIVHDGSQIDIFSDIRYLLLHILYFSALGCLFISAIQEKYTSILLSDHAPQQEEN